MAVTMLVGWRKISREEQDNYEIVIDGATKKFIRLQKKEVAIDGSRRCDNPVLHRCV